MDKVTILLAAYNGGAYIRQMIGSILEQDVDNWHLVVSDDGSADDTAAILDEFAAAHPHRITHYRSGRRFGNAQSHFLHLLQTFRGSDYILFCDQDDVWHRDKIRLTLEEMKRIEIPGKPALVHTDLRVVDGDLNEISPSFLRFSNLQGDRLELRQLLVQNVVTGCTVMINPTLAALVQTAPEQMLMHDWYLALVASALGTVGFLDRPTIDYRQHGNNSVGAKDSRSAGYILGRLRAGDAGDRMTATFRQARAFLEDFGAQLTPKQRKLVAAYANLEYQNWLSRRWAYLRWGFWKAGFLRKIGQLLLG